MPLARSATAVDMEVRRVVASGTLAFSATTEVRVGVVVDETVRGVNFTG